jgi:competence protein ComEC
MHFLLNRPIRRPLAVLTVVFCAGVCVANRVCVPFFAAYALALLLLIAGFCFLKRESLSGICIFLLVFVLGAVWLRGTQMHPRHHLSRQHIVTHGLVYIVKGFVDDEPVTTAEKTTFGFRTEQINDGTFSRTCSGRILVCIHGGKNLVYGQALLLKGTFYSPFGASRFKGTGYGNYLRRQGIWYIMKVRSEADLLRLAGNRGNGIKKCALRLKQQMLQLIFKKVSFLSSGMVAAMILGDKSRLSRFVYDSMVKSGTVHILVVSGFNVGIVSFVLNLILKLLRVPRIARLVLLIPLLVLYCLVTGASTPVIRATVMAIVFMSAYFVRRQSDIYNALGLAGLLIVGFNPYQLFDIGFQLSFGSVIGIVYLYPKIKALLNPEWFKIKGIGYLLEGGLVSCSAWLGTAGLVAYYFRIISPVTVAANLFIVPLSVLITLCGFMLVAAGLCCPALAGLFGASAELCVKLLVWCNVLLLKIPCAYVRFA